VTDSIQLLSGSTNGKGIKVTGTGSGSAVTVHTVSGGGIDLITLFAVNVGSAGRTLTMAWGGTGADDQWTVPVIPGAGPVLICDRMPLSSTLAASAWADSANDVHVYGYVLRSA